MAVSAGLGFDLDDVVKTAGIADKKLENMVKHSEQLEKNMREAFSEKDIVKIDRYVRSVQGLETSLGQISRNRVLFNVDDTKLKSAEDALGRIIEMVNEVSRNSGRMSLLGNDEVSTAIKRFYESQDKEMNRLNKGGSSNEILAQMRDYYREQERLARENAQKLIEIENRKNAEISRRVAEFDRWGNKVGRGGSTNSELSQMRDYYREQERLSKEAHDKEVARNKEQIKQIERRIDIQRRWDERRAKREEAQRGTYQGSLDYSKQVKSLNDIQKAIKYLDEARKKENIQTSQGKKNYQALTNELNRQRGVYNELTGTVERSSRGLLNTFDQLKRSFALVFSVSQIRGYIGQLVEVRGEFELQQRSLQAILQNKDEADKLWNRTVELAVRSPFRVKELVTYTKQLAAFRIESEKLYDTNKMLADISAGLGVEMNRLILALGQVKAANYLRGTELRQFSEAGVNILQALSEYYSKLENTAVSVSEVFERVSKRMVSYADVETVLRNMTQVGGEFYNMQEIQAETLQGQMSNLKDSIDIMLNEIGKANEGTIKDTVALVRSLVENWRSVATVLLTVGSSLATYKTLMAVWVNHTISLTKIVERLGKAYGAVRGTLIAMRRGIAAAEVAQEGFNKAVMKNVYVAAAALIVGAISAVIMGIKNARREQEELNRITKEGVDQASELSANFKRLADIATDPTSSIEKQKEALAELSRTYGDLLPYRFQDNTELVKMQGNYDSVTRAIYAKIEAQTKEKRIQEVEKNQMEDVNDTYDDLSEKLKKMGISSAVTRSILADYRQEVEKGNVDTQKLFTVFQSLVEKYTGKKISGSTSFIAPISAYRTAILELQSAIEDIKNEDLFGEEGFDTGIYKNLMAKFEEEKEKALKEWNTEDNEAKFPLTIEFDEKRKEEYKKRLQAFIDDIQKQIDNGDIEGIDATAAQNVIAKVEEEINKTDISPEIAQVNEWRLSISKLNNIDLNRFGQTIMREGQTFKEFGEQLKQEIEDVTADIATLNDKASTEPMKNAALAGFENVEEMERYLAALTALQSKVWFFPEKTTGGGSKDPEMDRIKERIRLINEMNKEYEKLLDNYYTEEEALAVIRKEYSESASTAGLNIANMRFDDDGTVAALEEEKAKYSAEKYANAYEKALDERRVELNIEAKVSSAEDLNKEVEELFEMVELSKELKELGLNQDIAGAFGFQFLDLEGLRANLEDMKDRFTGPKGEEDYQKFLERINALENKAMEERMKTYSKYLLQGYSERVKLKIEEMRKLKEIEEADEFTPEQKERITQGVNAETRKALQKQEWEDFKGSEMYTMMFEDLEYYGSAALDVLHDKLGELRKTLGELDYHEMREIIKRMNQIESIELGRNPFKYLGKLRAEIKKLKSEDELEIDLINAEKARKESQDAIDVIHTVQQKLAEGALPSIKELDTYNALEEKAREMGMNMEDYIEYLEEAVEEAEKLGLTAEEGLTRWAQYKEGVEGVGKAIADIAGLSDEVLGLAKEIATSLGGDTDSEYWSGLESAFGALGSAGSAIQSFASGDIIGGISQSIQAITQAIAAVRNFHDAPYKEEVEKQERLIANLEKQYNKLEKAIEDAWSTEQIEANTRALNENYEANKRALEAAIAAQRQVKGAVKNGEVNLDSEEGQKLQELIDAYDELNKTREEDLEGIFSRVTDGILDNVEDAARSFVDAWYDAFIETGDGLKGLEENFNEMFLNLAKQQAAQQIVGAYAEMWKKDLNKYINADSGDLTLTKDEAKRWAEEVRATFPQLSEALEGFLGTITEGLGTTGGGSLTALQRGIQSVSESTAQVIESLLSSIRLYVAGTNEYARDTATYTKKLFTLFDSLTASGHPSGGRGIRVII